MLLFHTLFGMENMISGQLQPHSVRIKRVAPAFFFQSFPAGKAPDKLLLQLFHFLSPRIFLSTALARAIGNTLSAACAGILSGLTSMSLAWKSISSSTFSASARVLF